MNVAGYRLRVAGLGALSHAVQGFRTDALRILARRYGGMVAEEAVRRLDLHRAGVEPRPREASPLSDAGGHLRQGYRRNAGGLNCEITFHLVGEAVLARFVHGDETFRRAWEGRREVVTWGWSDAAERPRGVSEADWARRGELWREALAKPGLGSGLRFTLMEGRPPMLGWGGVRRYLPSFEDRTRWVAEAIASSERTGGAPDPRKLAEAHRRATASLDRELGREHLSEYGRIGALAPAVAPRAAATRKASGPVMIDHADVIEAADGRLFVAVPWAGLEADSRVFLQVGDNRLTIVQNGVQFGMVPEVPRMASELLRECRHATLVEVEAGGERRLLRARHVAIVHDISLSDGVGRSLGRLRIRDVASRDRQAEEVRRWESDATGAA